MIHVPEQLVASQVKYNGEAGRAFVAALPERAEEFLGRWGLRVTGPSMYGMASLVLPVERVADGTPTALKMQILDEETEGEPVGLRLWDGGGIVRLLDHDAGTGTMLLERLDEARPLSAVPDTREAMGVVAGLLARLVALAGAGGDAGTRRHRGRDARGRAGRGRTPRRGGRGGAPGLRGGRTGGGGGAG